MPPATPTTKHNSFLTTPLVIVTGSATKEPSFIIMHRGQDATFFIQSLKGSLELITEDPFLQNRFTALRHTQN